MTMFAPMEIGAQRRSALYHAARLSMLHERVMKRLDRVERAADEVEHAAAVLVDVTHCSAVEAFQDAVFSNSSAAFLRLEEGQTLGL